MISGKFKNTSLGLENDSGKWDIFAEGFDWKGDWTVSTRYKLNDLVKYVGYIYVCTVGHTSAATVSSFTDPTNPGNGVTVLIQGVGFPFSGSAVITGSLVISGSAQPIIIQTLPYNASPNYIVTYNTSSGVVSYSDLPSNGSSGTSGASGTSGTSGESGTSGISGTSGTAGSSGTSGISGTSGTSGIAGSSGTSFLGDNYYGSFSDSTTQIVSGSNIPTTWTYNTTELSSEILVVSGSRIQVNNAGVYEIGYSAQVEATQNANGTDVIIWARINGNDEPRTTSTITMAGNGAYQLPFVAYQFDLQANDYVEFVVGGPNSNTNTQVQNSLTVTNVTPAVGGADQPSIEEAVSYRDYKKDPTSTPSQKVNAGIMEVNRMLSEMEKIVQNNLRLKTEMGVQYRGVWKMVIRLVS